MGVDYAELEKRVMARVQEPGSDVHTNVAADLLGCKPSEVTPTGRRVVKTALWHHLYSDRP